jgi:hypothetical protein
MTIPANVTLLASLNGGAPQSGGITAQHGDTCALSLQDPAGVTKARYEIYEYPDGFAVPAGWTADATGVYYVITAGAAAPTFTLPATVDLWGKFLFSVAVNDRLRNGTIASDLFDDATAVQILSPNGFEDVAFRETTQFDSQRQWAAALKLALRQMETGLVSITDPTTGYTVRLLPQIDERATVTGAGPHTYPQTSAARRITITEGQMLRCWAYVHAYGVGEVRWTLLEFDERVHWLTGAATPASVSRLPIIDDCHGGSGLTLTYVALDATTFEIVPSYTGVALTDLAIVLQVGATVVPMNTP